MTQRIPSCMSFMTALFILNMISGLLGLKNVEIFVQRYVRLGHDVRLSCHYDLEKDVLYAVKWYKAGPPWLEFYRYLPKESPSSKAFNSPGLYVDVTLSNDHDVLLKNVSFQTSGVYKCSVAAEFPFETRENSTEIRVVVIGDDAPVLRLDRLQYHPGDHISAECRTPASFPFADITWWFNDVKDHGRVLKTETRKDTKDPWTKSTVSTISFELSTEKVAPVRVQCQAKVLTVYDQKSNITTIHPIPRRLAGTETLLHSGSSRASTESFLFISLLSGIVNFALACRNICSTVF